jgi:hypothetical protein
MHARHREQIFNIFWKFGEPFALVQLSLQGNSPGPMISIVFRCHTLYDFTPFYNFTIRAAGAPIVPMWDIAAMTNRFPTPYLPLMRVALGFQALGRAEGTGSAAGKISKYTRAVKNRCSGRSTRFLACKFHIGH